MDSNFTTSTPESHPETTDFLSLAWCNFAVQAFQPDQQDRSVVLLDDPIDKFKSHNKKSRQDMDDADLKPPPPWKSNDVKVKHMSWKIVPFENMSIKKWLKDIKQRRKEEQRLQRAEVLVAVSMAGVAAALVAIAAEKSENDGSITAKEAAIASAAMLMAAQCAKVAEAMGARKGQLNSVIGSAMDSTSASDILTLTAAATTSLKGAATLKERSGCRKKRLNGTAPVMPIEDNPDAEEVDFDFDKYRSMLAIGSQLTTETPDGKCKVRLVSVNLNSEAKVLQMRKLSLFNNTKESIILDMYAELYKDSEAGENGTGYLIVLTTSRGPFKLDMEADYQRYKTWATTINHMLMVSTSFMKYHLQYYKN
ncbi:VAN3-binding protein [Pyrus x bretschneideri]|uniref:VAN3-binding protein n=1 Tax=Pyrus x bretschneideri TaxID=225117 RepID=UPI0020305C60|nr:VAN3-binding protein [Pyrus x bretschneideri]